MQVYLYHQTHNGLDEKFWKIVYECMNMSIYDILFMSNYYDGQYKIAFLKLILKSKIGKVYYSIF